MSSERVEGLAPEALLEVPVRVWVELGRTRMLAAEAAALEPGAVVDLDQALEEPIEAYVEGRAFARGTLVLVDGEWAIRIDELLPRGDHGAADEAAAQAVERPSSIGEHERVSAD